MLTFDTNLYERPIRAPIVDTFQLGNAAITKSDLQDKWVPAANRRHNKGEHAAITVGHTRDGMTREEDQPTVVGILTGPFAYHDTYPGVDGPCMSGMHYISKERTIPCDGVALKLSAREILDRWPRRSAELWLSDYKIDPHCLLGATTPCRELGPLRLSRDGELVVERELTYPLRLERDMASDADDDDEKDKKPKGDEKDTGVMKQLDALRADIAKLNEALSAITAQTGPAPTGAPGGQPVDPNEQAEIEALLAQLHGDDGSGQEPEPEPAPAPKKKLGRDPEVERLRTQLRRMEVVQDLTPLGLNTDDVLVADLCILPPDVYSRQVDRLKLSRPTVAPVAPSSLATAVSRANPVLTGKKRLETPEQNAEVVKLAAQKGVDYFQAKTELGYE